MELMRRMLRISVLGLLVIDIASCGGDGERTSGPESPVTSVTVSPGELALVVGESKQLTAVARDQAGHPLDGKSIAWATTEPTIASVSGTGVVRGIGAGSVTITATSEGKSGSTTATVTDPVTVASITVSPVELTLLVGEQQQLTAVVRDQAGNPLQGKSVMWSTTEPAIASVSGTGLLTVVTGVGVGSVTITANSEGVNGSASVSVVSVTFASVTTGGAHTCALTASGAAYCWGRGESGQLGVPVPTTTCMTDGGPFPCLKTPSQVGGGLVFVQLAGGGAHTCGLTNDGSAYCWGSNGGGQLGDNSTSTRNAPTPVATELKFASIDAGAQHTCALTGEGNAYCWGSNGRGQLGDGTTTPRSVPVAVTGGHTFQVIAAGGFTIGHTCAVTTSGNAYCWGDNERGQLGNGTGGLGDEDLTANPVPAPVTTKLTFIAVTAGLGRHTCGFTGTGDAYCWGENTFGALGNESTEDSSVPVSVSGLYDFVQLVAGGFIGHTCGITAEDTGFAYCWGENETGQVGDGSTFDRLRPSAVAGGLTFTRLDAGFRHTCGPTSSGVYCWGSGGAGQLGTNSTDRSAVPKKVLGQP
jgi:alpha-tubulin suppressor-like RCC1 family protein